MNLVNLKSNLYWIHNFELIFGSFQFQNCFTPFWEDSLTKFHCRVNQPPLFGHWKFVISQHGHLKAAIKSPTKPKPFCPMPNGLPVTEAATGPAMEALGDGGVGLSELEIEWLYVIPQTLIGFPNQKIDYNMALQKMIVSKYCFPLKWLSFEWRWWSGPRLDLELHFGRSGWKEAHCGGPQDPCNIRLPVCNMQLLGQDHPSPPKKMEQLFEWCFPNWTFGCCDPS